MRLAREIAEIADEKHSYSDDATGASGIDITAGQLESIIAAKLEPVRDALRSAWAGEVCGPEMCCESPACKQVAEIWESLSEE